MNEPQKKRVKSRIHYQVWELDSLGPFMEVKQRGNIYLLALGVPLFKDYHVGVNSSICLDGAYMCIKPISSSSPHNIVQEVPRQKVKSFQGLKTGTISCIVMNLNKVYTGK